MARSHARLLASIWADDDFIALPPGAQRMYMFLISQQDLQHCGVIALRERRWSKKASGLSVDDVRADLKVLAAHRFVVIDDDAEELLVRSLIRRDKVYAQPNVFKAAAEQIRAVSSREIKAALLDELKRLPSDELKGATKALQESLIAELTKIFVTPSGTPSLTPSGTTSDPLSGAFEDAAGTAPVPPAATDKTNHPMTRKDGGVSAGPKGSGRGSGTPSEQVPSEPRGKGSSYGEQVVVPLPPEPLPVPPSAGAAAPDAGEPVTAQTIVGEWIERCAQRPPQRVIGQLSKEIKALLDEGIHPDHVRAGVAEWMTRNAHPSTLASFVNGVMNARAAKQGAAPTSNGSGSQLPPRGSYDVNKVFKNRRKSA